MINYDDAQKALNFLVDTDIDYGRAKSLYDGYYEQRKTIRASVFLNSEGSAALRMEIALDSRAYREHLSLMRDAQMDYEILRSQRLTNQIIIDMWRSVNSAQKMGNV